MKTSALWKTLAGEEGRPRTRRKYLKKTSLIKDCYPKYTMNSSKPTRKQATRLKDGPKRGQLSEEQAQEKVLHIVVLTVTQTENNQTPLHAHQRPPPRALTTPSAGEAMVPRGLLLPAGGRRNGAATVQSGGVSQNSTTSYPPVQQSRSWAFHWVKI